MWQKFFQVWKLPELRKSILFVVGVLVVFRFAAAIPLPGIDPLALRDFFNSNEFFGLVNIFSGGGLERFSLMALGVAPYITASIIMQLLGMIVPRLEALSKEGERGQQKINQYTRYLTLPLAALQGFGIITLLRQSSQAIFGTLTTWDITIMLLMLCAGTMLLMWLGELISEKKIGNGISILIFAGIIAVLPNTLRSLEVIDSTQIVGLIAFLVIGFLTIVFVVLMTDGQRNIPVSYARQLRGMRLGGGAQTFLPLKVNQAGMIPIIFAISVILFPSTIAQFFLQARTPWMVDAANWVIVLFSNQLFYGILYFLLVVGFTYFYTAIVFKPDQVAENLQKQGGFIPGIRPGRPTADHLNTVMNRIVLPGSLFLGFVAVIPLIVQSVTGITTLAVEGASILIVVGVVMEIFKQVEAQLVMRDYEEI